MIGQSFGHYRIVEQIGAGDLAASPTISEMATRGGVILETAA